MKRVLFVGTLNLKLHCATDEGAQLPGVFVVDGLTINLLSLHAVQAKHAVTLDSTWVHLLGGKITFLRRATRSFVRATRLPPSYPVKLAAAASVHVHPSPPPPPRVVESSAVRTDDFLPPQPTGESSGVRANDFVPPPPYSRVEWSAYG